MHGSDGAGRDGLIGYVYACAKADLQLGAKLLMCIAPRQIDATITRNETIYKTIEELDQDLVQRGLPSSREIFKLDFAPSEDEPELAQDNDPSAPELPVSK
jgi:hypothetical protein